MPRGTATPPPYPGDMRLAEKHPRLFLSLAALGIGGFLWLSISAQHPAPAKPSIADQKFDVQADAIANDREFHGYGCTQDCSGHEAGYQWAAEQGIDDEGACDNASDSFTEGCLTYVWESEAEAER